MKSFGSWAGRIKCHNERAQQFNDDVELPIGQIPVQRLALWSDLDLAVCYYNVAISISSFSSPYSGTRAPNGLKSFPN